MSRPPRPSHLADATPLGDVDVADLIPTFVATRGDVNLAEQVNIETAMRWAFGRRRVATPERLLTIEFSDRVHQRMFGDVWKWAGQRRTQRDERGIAPDRIEPSMKVLFDDARFWHTTGLHSPAKRAIQLHDGLLKIHAYPHGNGRHARLMADLYLHLIDQPRLSWGTARDIETDDDSQDTEKLAPQQALDQASPAGHAKELERALDDAMNRPH